MLAQASVEATFSLGNPCTYIDNFTIPAAAREFCPLCKHGHLGHVVAPPLTDYTLRCDCGNLTAVPSTLLNSCINASLKILKITFVLRIFLQKNWKMLQKVPKRTLFFTLKIAIMNVIHNNATSMILICLCRLQSHQCGVPRRYRWYSAGGQNCPAARGATMLIIQHGG